MGGTTSPQNSLSRSLVLLLETRSETGASVREQQPSAMSPSLRDFHQSDLTGRRIPARTAKPGTAQVVLVGIRTVRSVNKIEDTWRHQKGCGMPVMTEGRCFETRAWSNVEDGSTVELSVTAPNSQGLFTATGRMQDGFDQEIWPQHEIRPGPRQHDLQRDRAYFVTCIISFQDSAPDDEVARVEFRIRRPHGSIRHPVYVWEVEKSACADLDQVRGVWITMAPKEGA